MKKPAYYAAPLRGRTAIVDWIAANVRAHADRSGRYAVCFDVKCYNADFSFDNLLGHWARSEGDPAYCKNDVWLAAARARHAETGVDRLREWGLEGARSHFVGAHRSDCYRMLWSGKALDVGYEFIGRQGGWLAIEQFAGVRLALSSDWSARAILDQLRATGVDEVLPYADLRDLYQLIVMLEHDLRPEAVRAEIEHCAAFDFFANVAADIPQPDFYQPSLPFPDDVAA